MSELRDKDDDAIGHGEGSHNRPSNESWDADTRYLCASGKKSYPDQEQQYCRHKYESGF
jgi:hypothetical protein